MPVGFGLGITNLLTVDMILHHSEGLTVSNYVADKRPGLAFRRTRTDDFYVQTGVNDAITITDGGATTYAIAAGVYADATALATAIDTAITASGIACAWDSSDEQFVFTRTATSTFTIHTPPATGAAFIGFPNDGTTVSSSVVGPNDEARTSLGTTATGQFVVYDAGASGITPDAIALQLAGDDAADYSEIKLYASNTLHSTTEDFSAWESSAPFNEDFTSRATESPNKLQVVLTTNTTAYRYWRVQWSTPQTNQQIHQLEVIRAWEVDTVAAGIAAPRGAGPKDPTPPLGPGNYYPMRRRRFISAALTFPTWKADTYWRALLMKLIHLAGRTEPVLVAFRWTLLVDHSGPTVASAADIEAAIVNGHLFFGIAVELPEEDYGGRGDGFISGQAVFRQLV